MKLTVKNHIALSFDENKTKITICVSVYNLFLNELLPCTINGIVIETGKQRTKMAAFCRAHTHHLKLRMQ